MGVKIKGRIHMDAASACQKSLFDKLPAFFKLQKKFEKRP